MRRRGMVARRKASGVPAIHYCMKGVPAGSTLLTSTSELTVPEGESWNIDFGDGESLSGITDTKIPAHQYVSDGDYNVSITGDFLHLGGRYGSISSYTPVITFNSRSSPYVKDIIIDEGFGESITSLRCCFECFNYITSLRIPKGFGALATNATNMFASCNRLESIEFPDGFGSEITSASATFYSCKVLKELTLPKGFGTNITSSGGTFGFFQNCTSLTSLILPDGFGTKMTSLANMFRGCTSIYSISFPDGFGAKATAAGASIFYDCKNLTVITGDLSLGCNFTLSTAPSLSKESILNVLNSIRPVTTTKTLTLGETHLSKLTESEKAIATNKGWTLA